MGSSFSVDPLPRRAVILFRHRVVTGIGAAVLLLCGSTCSGDGSSPADGTPVGGVDQSDTADVSIEVPVSYPQADALVDGVVTVDEMQAALDSVVDCLAEIGIEASIELSDEAVGLSGGWELIVPVDTAGDVVHACQDASVGEMVVPFFLGGGDGGAARVGEVSRCLEDAGLPGDRERLVELVEAGDDQLQGCLESQG